MFPDMSFRASAASRGIFPSCRFYLVVVLSPTWWIPPLRFAAVGMTYWKVIPFCPHRLYSERGGRQIAAPTVTLMGGTVQPHRLYTERSGRQDCRPYKRGTIYSHGLYLSRKAPGTAHRPFPTVSLTGPFFQPP